MKRTLILLLALVAIATTTARAQSGCQGSTNYDAVRVGQDVVMVNNWYLFPNSHYVRRSEAVVEVPIGAVLRVEDRVQCGDMFRTTWNGHSGWMQGNRVVSYADAVRNGAVILSAAENPRVGATYLGMSIYPNPSAGPVYVEDDRGERVPGTVYDLTGRRVLTTNGLIDEGLPSGTYLFRADRDGAAAVFTVI